MTEWPCWVCPRSFAGSACAPDAGGFRGRDATAFSRVGGPSPMSSQRWTDCLAAAQPFKLDSLERHQTQEVGDRDNRNPGRCLFREDGMADSKVVFPKHP